MSRKSRSRSSSDAGSALVCPSCGREFPIEERFCDRCKMPLVSGEVMEHGLSDAHERARKIDPQYSRGRLVRVAGARHQAEAELLQGLLLEEGVPSVMRRSAGADVPDFLAAGARDILVPQSGVEAARAILGQSGLEPQLATPSRPDPRQVILIIGAIFGGGGLIALIAWALQHT